MKYQPQKTHSSTCKAAATTKVEPCGQKKAQLD